MYASDGVTRVIEELEFLRAERRQMSERGPHFMIVHRYNQPFSPCGAHEEIAAVYLIYGGDTFQVGLGTILSVLFDFLARHNQLAQTAKQLERGTWLKRLCGERTKTLATNSLSAGVPRRYVRVYIQRIRAALGEALRTAGLDIEPEMILISEETATNEIGYRLCATFEWFHTET